MYVFKQKILSACHKLNVRSHEMLIFKQENPSKLVHLSFSFEIRNVIKYLFTTYLAINKVCMVL
jgi:hypothetical protein